jgi:hypothetical protein
MTVIKTQAHAMKRSNRVGSRRIGSSLAMVALAASIGACSSSSGSTPESSPPTETAAPIASAAVGQNSVAGKKVSETEWVYEDFQQSNFDENSINIDNKYFPLIPGTRHDYDGSTIEDGKTLLHRVQTTVTSLTKKINGVNAVVLWERDFSDGELEEDELTFFAQDKSGNVWHLGQYSELWESGEFLAGRTWLVGNPANALAGIMMKADPKPNEPDWSEGYAPAPYFWTDRARVRVANEKTTVPTATYDGVLVVEESNQEEPSQVQLKYYAPGVGVVRVGWAGTDETKETLLMVRTGKLSPEELVEASKQALELEARALVHSTAGPAVFRK